MNKLISRNPVERFKLGKSIRKMLTAAGGPLNLPAVINNPVSNVPATTIKSGLPAVRSTSLPSIASKPGLLGRASRFIGRYVPAALLAYITDLKRQEAADKLKSGEYTIAGGRMVKNDAAAGAKVGIIPNKVPNHSVEDIKALYTEPKTAKRRDYGKGKVEYAQRNGIWYARWTDPTKPNQGYYRVAEGSTGYNKAGDHNVLKNGEWVKIKESPNKITSTNYTRNTGYNNQYGFAGDIQRNWRGTKGVINENDLKLLLEMGFTGKTAREAQKFMNNNFGGSGLYGYKVAADNAWGEQSNRALLDLYKAWKEQLAIKPQTVKPIIELPKVPTAPVMQRQAISDYSNYASNLKQTLGRNNNFAGLSNLVWKEYADDDNSFAANFSRDMRKRFSDYTTQQSWLDNLAAIENALNIRGGYHGVNGGDYSDISRSMANWAGNYNYNIDKLNQTALDKFDTEMANYNALMEKYKNALAGKYKLGGTLPSRNIVERFKQRNFRLVAQ